MCHSEVLSVTPGGYLISKEGNCYGSVIMKWQGIWSGLHFFIVSKFLWLLLPSLKGTIPITFTINSCFLRAVLGLTFAGCRSVWWLFDRKSGYHDKCSSSAVQLCGFSGQSVFHLARQLNSDKKIFIWQLSSWYIFSHLVPY